MSEIDGPSTGPDIRIPVEDRDRYVTAEDHVVRAKVAVAPNFLITAQP